MITFTVDGNPVPKQSYRHSSKGGYTPQRVKDWQQLVSLRAREVFKGDPLTCPVSVQITFYIGDHRRKDLDNLSKAVLDALNGIILADDQQVEHLCLSKRYDKRYPCAIVKVSEA